MSLIIILVIMFIHTSNNEYGWESYNYEIIKYQVKAGDTLWAIAKKHKPKQIKIREYIYYLRKLNEDKVKLIIGDEIKVYKIKS
ncbi:LysM peptidoglycan-binding domain-containing protein [Selenihalanaerobacter shriftii]|uniref:LysM domain-containing protein n=1 Tax=Selenihalanaerobacter shriftii TaxID=142842 RepID=A0A1T4LYJ8_9FIRM|nr:LysM domain-containing protein [Selenihalanaerobacter shriftii]SJZ59721.1 LysM domain-containing protein [Selenihalanaerobacter shriftii]